MTHYHDRLIAGQYQPSSTTTEDDDEKPKPKPEPAEPKRGKDT